MLFKEGLQGIEEKVLGVHGTRCNLPILALCGRRCHLGTVDCDQGPPGKRAMARGAQERTDVQSTLFLIFFSVYILTIEDHHHDCTHPITCDGWKYGCYQ